MNNLEIKVGNVYSAKRPRETYLPGEGRFICDRQVIYYDGFRVQYDSPSIKPGQKYPMVSEADFLKCEKENITDQMPKGEWRKTNDNLDT